MGSHPTSPKPAKSLKTSTSVEMIRGYTSAAHVLARRVAVLGEEVVAEVGVKVVAMVDSLRLGLRLVFFFSLPSSIRESAGDL